MCEGCCCARMAFLLLPAEVGGAASLASSWQQSRLGVAGWAVFFERRRFLADLGERSKKRASWKSSELRLLSCTCKTELSRDEIGAESAAESGTPHSTTKLVATNLIAEGKLWQGVQLLCLINKVSLVAELADH